MELLQTYSRVNEDRPKPSEKIPFVRRMNWMSMSIWDLNTENPRLTELFGKL